MFSDWRSACDLVAEAAPRVPQPRRTARVVAPDTAEGVLLHVLREVMAAPDGEPDLAQVARRLALRVRGRSALLHQARIRLQRRGADRASLLRARALAVLDLALVEVEAPRALEPSRVVGPSRVAGPSRVVEHSRDRATPA